ncbi:unnamed protein product, partial [marine sediment metagenome]
AIGRESVYEKQIVGGHCPADYLLRKTLSNY